MLREVLLGNGAIFSLPSLSLRGKGLGKRKAYAPNSIGLCLAISDRNGTLLFMIGDLITI